MKSIQQASTPSALLPEQRARQRPYHACWPAHDLRQPCATGCTLGPKPSSPQQRPDCTSPPRRTSSTIRAQQARQRFRLAGREAALTSAGRSPSALPRPAKAWMVVPPSAQAASAVGAVMNVLAGGRAARMCLRTRDLPVPARTCAHVPERSSDAWHAAVANAGADMHAAGQLPK